MDDHQARKLAQNETLARDVNERVGEVSASWYAELEPLEFVCECSLADCTARVHLQMDDYRRVRASPIRFAVVREHVVPEIELVVEELDDAVVVVEKIGPGREVAVERAP